MGFPTHAGSPGIFRDRDRDRGRSPGPGPAWQRPLPAERTLRPGGGRGVCDSASRPVPSLPVPPAAPLLVGAAAVPDGSCSRRAGGLAFPACPAPPPPPWVRAARRRAALCPPVRPPCPPPPWALCSAGASRAWRTSTSRLTRPIATRPSPVRAAGPLPSAPGTGAGGWAFAGLRAHPPSPQAAPRGTGVAGGGPGAAGPRGPQGKGLREHPSTGGDRAGPGAGSGSARGPARQASGPPWWGEPMGTFCWAKPMV